ncbi:hypothetical protein OIO90_001181 [Microbotryomycetes sp. JL221]|nr:hypothetical protein OIO90_001181 [Microbotryomycetes sp. JL221]
MAIRPVVGTPLASCCTVLSVIGVVFLLLLGLAFSREAHVLVGSTKFDADPQQVANTCYFAAVVYAVFVVFCGMQTDFCRLIGYFGFAVVQVQGHMNDNELHLCHTSCLLLDAGKFSDYLSQVKSWLDDNKNEVVTILMVNSDGVDASVWQQAYVESGLDSYAYQPSSVPVSYDSWPTLQQLIDSGKRSVNFLAQGADMSTAPYLLDEFTHMWETPFSQTDASFPCTVDRVTGDYQGKMYLINHNLNENKTLLGQTIPVPAVNQLEQTNAVSGSGSLGAQAQLCESNWGYKPTFTLVDFYDVGDGTVFQYAANVNGVSYNAVEIGNGTTGQSDGTTRSAGGAVESRPLGAASGYMTKTLLELTTLFVIGAVALIIV